MYWRDTVTLEAVTHGADEEGYPKEAVEETEVFADVQSVRRSEFYAAKQIGVTLLSRSSSAPPTMPGKSALSGMARGTRSSGPIRRRGKCTSSSARSSRRRRNEYRGAAVEAFDGLMNSPAAANTYKGDDAEYITFNYTEIPDDFGDDDAGHYRALVQVHYFAPHEKNTRATRREITRRIVAAGFTRPSITPASDANGQHYVFECEDAEAV